MSNDNTKCKYNKESLFYSDTDSLIIHKDCHLLEENKNLQREVQALKASHSAMIKEVTTLMQANADLQEEITLLKLVRPAPTTNLGFYRARQPHDYSQGGDMSPQMDWLNI